ncbi:MAG: trehalose-phosphatase [Candidatus Binataceae bacterium]
MPSTPRPARTPERVPKLLPGALLTDLLSRGPLLLCLDYDGTLAEIVPDPARAYPLTDVREALEKLAAARSRVRVAIVSGRDLATLERLLGGAIEGVMMAGTHGLELVDENGQRRLASGAAACEPELDRVRAWLQSAARENGFTIEDKGCAVALHYRNAPVDKAAQVRGAFERFVKVNAPHLKLQPGKMVVEALPAIAGKGVAVNELTRQAGAAFTPVYFGDDLTDEDAFRALAGRGVTVLVGKARPSAATYHVSAPRVVAELLRDLALVANL